MPGVSPSSEGAQLPFWESQEKLSCFSSVGWKDTALRVCREVSLTRVMWWFRGRRHKVGLWDAALGLSSARKLLIWGLGGGLEPLGHWSRFLACDG